MDSSIQAGPSCRPKKQSYIRSRNDQWMGSFWGDLELRTYLERHFV